MRLAGAILLLLGTSAAAQWPGDQEIPKVAIPKIPAHSSTVSGFVPKGWLLEAKAVGDLNGDKLPDVALVLHMDDPANRIHPSYDQTQTYDTNPRMIVIAFAGNEGGGFRLAASNYTLIPRLENPNQDDPFDSIAIANGNLKVKMVLFMSAGGWMMGNTAITFRWIDDKFRMIGFDRDAIMRNSGETEKTSINYLTGRKIVNTGSLDGQADPPKTTRLPKKPLLRMDQVVDGLYFEPDEH